MAAPEVARRAAMSSKAVYGSSQPGHRGSSLYDLTADRVSPLRTRWKVYTPAEATDATSAAVAAAAAAAKYATGKLFASDSSSTSTETTSTECTEDTDSYTTSDDEGDEIPPPPRAAVVVSTPPVFGHRQSVDNYRILGDAMAIGAHAAVYRAVSTGTRTAVGIRRGTMVAIKAMRVDTESVRSGEAVAPDVLCRNEVAATRTAACAHVIRIFETMEFGPWFCIVMEFAHHGDLFDYIVAKSGNPGDRDEAVMALALNPDHQTNAWRIGRQLAKAVAHTHASRIAHRDIKPENVLIVSRAPLRIVLADYGMAHRACHGKHDRIKLCGSLEYAAPEIVNPVEYAPGGVAWGVDPFKADVWSFAVTLYITAHLHVPVPRRSIIETRTYENMEAVHEHIHPRTICALEGSLVVDPSKRKSISECLVISG